MPAQYLANHDGSEQGAGRGSGLSTEKVSAQTYATIKTHPKPPPPVPGKTMDMMTAPLSKLTPYMQMTFAPLERRLDTAVFRALFASSIRQARQFVLHGGVKVNGKKVGLVGFSKPSGVRSLGCQILTIADVTSIISTESG